MTLVTYRHTPLDPSYIGDGVYASHDGYAIWLTCTIDGRVQEVCLEPEVLEQLDRYRAWLAEKAIHTNHSNETST